MRIPLFRDRETFSHIDKPAQLLSRRALWMARGIARDRRARLLPHAPDALGSGHAAGLALLRGTVRGEMLETYPEYCARVFGRKKLL
jgi:hypothetical protein